MRSTHTEHYTMKKPIIISIIAIISALILSFAVYVAFSYRDMTKFNRDVIPVLNNYTESFKLKNHKELIYYYNKLDSINQNLEKDYYIGNHEGNRILKEMLKGDKQYIDSLKVIYNN